MCAAPAGNEHRVEIDFIFMARRLTVLWSGAFSSTFSSSKIDAIRPSVWRSACRNTRRSIKLVSIAKSEWKLCPLWVLRGWAAHRGRFVFHVVIGDLDSSTGDELTGLRFKKVQRGSDLGIEGAFALDQKLVVIKPTPGKTSIWSLSGERLASSRSACTKARL